MVIYSISDLHTDFPENIKWVEELPSERYKNDCVLLPGDITDNIATLERTFKAIVPRFKHVFYCPGNHELWIHKDDKKYQIFDSVAKFNYIMKLCKNLGIHTSTYVVDDVTIVPLFAWHDNSLLIERLNLVTDINLWADTSRCVWPKELKTREDITKYFTKLNENHMPKPTAGSKIITFSHFFPSMELMLKYFEIVIARHEAKKAAAIREGKPLPQTKEKYSNFSQIAGTGLLGKQIVSLNPIIHVYGHSHRKMEFKLSTGETSYINQPLGYPSERNSKLIDGPFEPYQIYPIHMDLS